MPEGFFRTSLPISEPPDQQCYLIVETIYILEKIFVKWNLDLQSKLFIDLSILLSKEIIPSQPFVKDY